jgi:hypothetical protein
LSTAPLGILKREHFEQNKLYVVSSVTGTTGFGHACFPLALLWARAELAERATFQEQRAQW